MTWACFYPDTREVTDAEFKLMRPVGRPKALETKERITIRLSRDVFDSFRAGCAGWTCINEALKEWMREYKRG